MKYLHIILALFAVISCSESDSDHIQTIENAIKVPILTYKTIDYKDIGSLGYPVSVIDVTFSEAEFNAIIQKIDLKAYTKEDGDYFKDFASDSIKWHIALYAKENKIRYAELD